MITPIEKKLLAYLNIILVVLILLTFLVYRGVRTMTLSGHLVEHTLQVQGEVKTLTSQINQVGEIAREYFLTPDAALLESYAEVKSQLDSQILRIKSLTNNRAKQQQRLEEAGRLISQRLDLLDSMIQSRQKDEFDVVARLLRIARLSQSKNELSKVLGEMEQEEQWLYGEHSRQQASDARVAMAIAVIGILIAAGLLAMTWVSIRRETVKQLEGGQKLRSAEDAFYESEERFRQIAENIEAVLWIRNAQTGELEFVSPVIERLWGINAHNLLSQTDPWSNYIHPDDLERAQASVRADLAAGGLDQEYRIIAPDGRQCWVRDRGFPVKDKSGKVRHMVGFTVDTTERKEAEEFKAVLFAREHAARAQAETANRTKDEFLAIVSHELRSPLNAMLGWARVLRSENVDQETHNHAIRVIEQSAEMQSRLIEDLLDSARIASGKLRIESRPVNLIPAIQSAIDTVQPAAESRGVEIHADLELAQLDPNAGIITGDAGRLQQIIWNLLTNAVKFTPRGGRVEITLKRQDPWATVTITDTGRGINAEDLPFIFDLFRQADSSDTRPVGGLGLGLSLVKDLVELHGGQITAESEGAGKGATFTIKLPLRAVSGKLAESTRELNTPVDENTGTLNFPSVLDGLRILTVDDEADARDLVTLLLSKYGAAVTAASSSAEAMDFLTNAENGDSFDLIVSDIGMPDENGYTLMRRVRQLPAPKGKIPAVALTAFGRAEDRIRALQAGFQMHVPKPVEPAELMVVIARLTGRSVKPPTE